MMKTNLIKMICAAGATLPALAMNAQERPNIIYILTDQQNVDMISALNGDNSPFVSTPNLDRLVKKGYSFTNSYCANPLSVPSRFALITGQSGAQFGVRNNNPDPARKEEVLEYTKKNAMGSIFRKAGYDTYYGGKVHLPFASGSNNKDKVDRYGFELIEESSREELAETASKFITERKGQKPFLLYLSYINPHDICEESWLKILPEEAYKKAMSDLPLETLKPYHEKLEELGDAPFEKDGISNLMKNPGPMKGHKLGEARWKDTEHITPVEWRKYRWVYYRLVENVDGLIGKVLDALEKSQYNDNTIIVFTSDHGEMGGSHGLRGKNILFEECMKVPFVVAGKGVKNKIDKETLICNGQDLLPTLCDMASIKPGIDLRGKSLWGLVTGKQKSIDRDYIFMECASSFCVLDTEGNKYTKYDKVYANGMEVFANIKSDPLELENLIGSEKYQSRINELRSICSKRLDEIGFAEPTQKFKKEKKDKSKDNDVNEKKRKKKKKTSIGR